MNANRGELRNVLRVACYVISVQRDWRILSATSGVGGLLGAQRRRYIFAMCKSLISAIIGGFLGNLDDKKDFFSAGPQNLAALALFVSLSLQSFSLSNPDAPARDESRIFGSTAAVRTMGKRTNAKDRRKYEKTEQFAKSGKQEGEWQ